MRARARVPHRRCYAWATTSWERRSALDHSAKSNVSAREMLRIKGAAARERQS
jgi:hypothetical protein